MTTQSGQVDPVSWWRAWARKITPIRIVCRRPPPLLSRDDFVERATALVQRARSRAAAHEKIEALWELETLAAAFVRERGNGSSLGEIGLPPEALPIAHAGMAVAAVESSRFERSALMPRLESLSALGHVGFAYESLGAVMELYRRDWFHVVVRTAGVVGAVPFVPLHTPRSDAILSCLGADGRRLVAHGRGRVAYFKSRRADLDRFAWVQGATFAHTLVNGRDLPAMVTATAADGEFAAAVSRGQVVALTFLEWFSPGFLDALACRCPLVAAAHAEASANRARGFLQPFASGMVAR